VQTGVGKLILDKSIVFKIKIVVERRLINKVFLLLVLSLFLVEYLNPSVIGVRADYTPSPAGSHTTGNPVSPEKDAPSATPHFMVKMEPYRLGKILLSLDSISYFQSIVEQTNPKEIFHPPAVAL
jgi:hypothetical protein